MGQRHAEKESSNPGPGQYDVQPQKVKVSMKRVLRFGSAPRRTYWADGGGQKDQPGPGNYTDRTKSIGGSTVKGGFIG